MRDWDDAFANMAHVEGSEKLPDFWANRAKKYRLNLTNARLDVPYGSEEREVFDLILPDAEPLGLAVFVHGGYWMRLDKSYWTDLAEGARSLGWAVCIPSYTLTPKAKISQITNQIAACVNEAATLVDGPIRLAGHSAGGHLVTRMVCADSALLTDVLERIELILSISGLYDLRPLRNTVMNKTLNLSEKEADTESPALLCPTGSPNLIAWVGGGERPEFIRQARLMSVMWESFDCEPRLFIDGNHNHFTILEGLKESGSDITNAFLS